MRLMVIVLAVAVLAMVFLGAAPARTQNEDPIVGNWKWFDGSDLHFRANNTIHKDGKKVADWYKGDFKHDGGKYDYKLVWLSGYTDWVNLAKKDTHLVGINNEGAKITGDKK
jgi:hypothetical protein